MHSALPYKLKSDYLLQFEDQKLPLEMAKNCLTKENKNLLFGGWHKKCYFSPRNAKPGVQKNFFGQSCRTKKVSNFLFLSLSVFSQSLT